MTLTRRDVLVRLADRVEAVRCEHPVRVGLDGPDAAGKTTLADELAGALRERGRTVIRASLDGFHRPRAERYRRGDESPEGYYLDSFDLAAVRSCVLDPLGPGGDRSYRTAAFDLAADRPLAGEVQAVDDDAILLFDGVFLLRPQLRDLWELSIFVTAGLDVTLARARRRDAAVLGSPELVEQRYRARYIPGQLLYVAEARPAEMADLVVRNDDPAAPVLLDRTRSAPHGPARLPG